MLKIRLQGTLEEINQAKERLSKDFKVLSVSEPYKNRGENEYYRVYIDCEMREQEDNSEHNIMAVVMD